MVPNPYGSCRTHWFTPHGNSGIGMAEHVSVVGIRGYTVAFPLGWVCSVHTPGYSAYLLLVTLGGKELYNQQRESKSNAV